MTEQGELLGSFIHNQARKTRQTVWLVGAILLGTILGSALMLPVQVNVERCGQAVELR